MIIFKWNIKRTKDIGTSNANNIHIIDINNKCLKIVKKVNMACNYVVKISYANTKMKSTKFLKMIKFKIYKILIIDVFSRFSICVKKEKKYSFRETRYI